MCDLIARTGRLQQRYENGCRLVAGCIPFRYRDSEEVGDSSSGKVFEVLMISSSSGPGLVFPKGGWENDETVREAAAREAVEEAGVRGILMVHNNLFKSFVCQVWVLSWAERLRTGPACPWTDLPVPHPLHS